MLLSAKVRTTRCAILKYYILQAERISVILISSDQFPARRKSRFFQYNLDFRKHQAWSVCLSAKSSSEDDYDISIFSILLFVITNK